MIQYHQTDNLANIGASIASGASSNGGAKVNETDREANVVIVYLHVQVAMAMVKVIGMKNVNQWEVMVQGIHVPEYQHLQMMSCSSNIETCGI